jgi:acyl-CoA reductase-like NAD-dependent aldehyde dehydrogenase
MQTRLIHALARQHRAQLHQDPDLRRLANAVDREQDNVAAITTTALSDLLGRLRARLERRTEAFPLWQAVKAGLARVEAGVEAVEETIEGVPDKTSDLA